jgi:hypothetical protein
MHSLHKENIRIVEKFEADFELKARQTTRNVKRRIEEAEDDVENTIFGAGLA